MLSDVLNQQRPSVLAAIQINALNERTHKRKEKNNGSSCEDNKQDSQEYTNPFIVDCKEQEGKNTQCQTHISRA